MEITLQNIRSICRPQSIPLRPLTLLVGENSAGKTTFLAMVAHVNQSTFPSTRPTFNVPPFDLGTYDSIATYKGGRYGRATSFSVGFRDTDQNGERRVEATYSSHRGQPQVRHLMAKANFGEITIEIIQDSHTAHVVFKTDKAKPLEIDLDLREAGSPDEDLPFHFIARLALSTWLRKEQHTEMTPDALIQIPQLLRWSSNSVLSLAPVRTRPRRTYDEFSEEFDPEGDHVPVMLARLWEEGTEPTRAALVDALNEFGTSSGLYKKIGVRHLGHRPTDPFQIQVTMTGPAVNIPDVGYGVSQALPVIVQSVLSDKGGLLLLQQPEVHLHPRAQAALGTFFARLVAKDQKHLVIETHSDYILDRVRQEVAEGTLSSNDVMILFFDKEGMETNIHQITLDKYGNVLGAPGSYRQFFLKEEENLFSRAKK